MVYHLKICFTTIPTLKKEQSQLLLGVIQEVPFFWPLSEDRYVPPAVPQQRQATSPRQLLGTQKGS